MVRTHSLPVIENVSSITAPESSFYPWPLLRKSSSLKDFGEIRLIIHGSSDGLVHPLFHSVVHQLREHTESSIVIEALTTSFIPKTSANSILIIPLFLLPGRHVCLDVPMIRNRFKDQGISTTLLPFLGSWLPWLSILQDFVLEETKQGSPALVHHPLAVGLGSRYLKFLADILKIPVVSWEDWNDFRLATQCRYFPIPFSMVPNRNTDLLRQYTADEHSSLLQIEQLRNALVQLLRFLL